MLLICIWLIFVLFICRCIYLMYQVWTLRRPQAELRNPSKPVRTLIVIGSGGHTAEMLKIVSQLNFTKYRPRIYAMASSDITSELKIVSMEYSNSPKGEYILIKIPRSRDVGQSFLTSIFTTLYSSLFCIPYLFYYRPELILCNGPGTCIPICVIAFLMRAAFISNNRIIFFESICRVWSLSLTGKLLLCIADNIFVQWPELKNTYRRTQYIGNL
uniref:UDP-N-acetylglucosamine transferase subunit ALG14 n=1 Tax=Panstrongylus lignarius TaxID=156445 RepID=A0A224XSN0_9HEMI